jgi:hypothetical protein
MRMPSWTGFWYRIYASYGFSQIFRCVSTNFVTWVTDIPALLGHDGDVQRESAAI